MAQIVAPKSWINPENHINVLLNHPWYKVLGNLYKSIFEATHGFYKSLDISPTLFPITTGSISSPMGLGSDSTPVSVEIKGNKVYLADSMQFCLEIGARLSDKGAYYIMPTFRGENMDERHLNEFVHSEVEIPGNINDIMKLAEDYIKYMMGYLLENNKADIASVAGTIDHLQDSLNKTFARISHDEALNELKDVDGATEEIKDNLYRITKIGEKHLLDKYGDFTWITDMPFELVPFYQAKQPDGKSAYAADLLAGIGEILGCGQRVLSVADLDESLKEHNVNASEYEWYREMRKIKEIQTSGFGLGIERFILWVLKHNDIRDCTLLLRDHTKITTP
jgi:aspartyl/asparaginyl-tRNA synthetase